MSNQEHPMQATLDELKKNALDHYEELATKCNHWNSFIPEAIKAYNPSSDLSEKKGEPVLRWTDAKYGLPKKRTSVRWGKLADGTFSDQEMGDASLVTELIENGWLNVEWLEEIK